MAMSPTRRATSTGLCPTRRCTRSSTTSSVRSAPSLYGRKMYETMAAWEMPETIPNWTPAMLEFAGIWQAADKVVYSKTLDMRNVRLSKPYHEPQHPFNHGFDSGLLLADWVRAN